MDSQLYIKKKRGGITNKQTNKQTMKKVDKKTETKTIFDPHQQSLTPFLQGL